MLVRNVMFAGKKLLIFDLGGVLIDLHLERTFAALVEMGADASMLTERECLLNTMMKQFDCGTITTEEMFGYIASQLPLQTREKFGAALGQRIGDVWNMMLGSYPLYKFNRLRELRSRGFRVVMLSNTNAGSIHNFQHSLISNTFGVHRDRLSEQKLDLTASKDRWKLLFSPVYMDIGYWRGLDKTGRNQIAVKIL